MMFILLFILMYFQPSGIYVIALMKHILELSFNYFLLHSTFIDILNDV